MIIPWLRLEINFEKTLHCSELKHYPIIHISRQIIEQNMRLFGGISPKETLRSYKAVIDDNSKMYYNKSARYQMEHLDWFIQSPNISPQNLNIVFEDTNVDYEKYIIYFNPPTESQTCKQPKTVIYRHAKIKVKRKSEQPYLELADLVAQALYKCVDKQTKQFNMK